MMKRTLRFSVGYLGLYFTMFYIWGILTNTKKLTLEEKPLPFVKEYNIYSRKRMMT